MKQNKKFFRFFWTTLLALSVIPTASWAFSSLAKNDPYPIHNTFEPHNFLLTKEKLNYFDPDQYDDKNDFLGLAVTIFAQHADRGRTYAGKKKVGGCPVNLSDLEGRCNMITLLYGQLPDGETLSPTLQAARDVLFPGVVGAISDPKKVDPDELFGFFSFPLKYRKRGVRFDLSANIYCGFGIKIEGGFASMCQTMTCTPIDLTCKAQQGCPFTFTDDEKDNVQMFLMQELKPIAEEIMLDITDFQECEPEEFRASLYWRNIYSLNEYRDDWPDVLLIPYFNIGGSISPGKKRNPNELFGLPFGNNGHSAVSFTTGLDLDFLESIEIGGEIGFTHFFSENICNFRVPNHPCQTCLFPFKTDVCYEPGWNWHFAGKIAAYHFVDRLSFWFQYLIIEHKEDEIKLQKPDPAFVPKVLEERSKWKAKFANIGLTYDISPNVGLGFTWQAPHSQRNTYRSSTVLFSLYGTY